MPQNSPEVQGPQQVRTLRHSKGTYEGPNSRETPGDVLPRPDGRGSWPPAPPREAQQQTQEITETTRGRVRGGSQEPQDWEGSLGVGTPFMPPIRNMKTKAWHLLIPDQKEGVIAQDLQPMLPLGKAPRPLRPDRLPPRNARWLQGPSRASGGPPEDAPGTPDKPRKPGKHHKDSENEDIPEATTQGVGQDCA